MRDEVSTAKITLGFTGVAGVPFLIINNGSSCADKASGRPRIAASNIAPATTRP